MSKRTTRLSELGQDFIVWYVLSAACIEIPSMLLTVHYSADSEGVPTVVTALEKAESSINEAFALPRARIQVGISKTGTRSLALLLFRYLSVLTNAWSQIFFCPGQARSMYYTLKDWCRDPRCRRRSKVGGFFSSSDIIG